jgi:hypothetical protein
MDDQWIYEWLLGSGEENKDAGVLKKMGDAVVGLFKWYVTPEYKPKSVPQLQVLW